MRSRYRLFLGIDVSKNGYQIAFLPVEQERPPSWMSMTSEFFAPCRSDFERIRAAIASWAKPEQVRAAIDHTGGYYVAPLVHFLHALGCSMVYVAGLSAKQLREKLFLAKAKSDDIDAKTLAYGLYLYHFIGIDISPVVADPGVEDSGMALLQLCRLRQQMVQARVQATNRLKQLLAAAFPEGLARHPDALIRIAAHYPTALDVRRDPDLTDVRITRRIRSSLVGLAEGSVGICSESLSESVVRWAQFRELHQAEILRLESRISALVDAHPYGAILQSFPNVGPVRAGLLIGLIRDVNRWPTANKLKKAFGIYGVTRQSGDMMQVTKGHEGNREGKILAMQIVAGCIQPTAKTPNDFRDCFQRHRKRGLPPMKAMYKSASKFLSVLHRCLQTGEPYRYQGQARRSPKHFEPLVDEV